MDRISLKEYAKAKVSGKRIIIWKALIFMFLANMVVSLFTSWIDTTIYLDYINSLEDIMPYFKNTMIVSIISMLLITPIQYGINQYLMDFDKDDFINNSVLFAPYKNIIKIFVLSLFVGFVCTLPMILMLIIALLLDSVPFALFAIFAGGAINFYLELGFSIIPYMFNENSDKSIIEIMKISALMMKGYKMDYFILSISFLGWMLFGVFTCGIGMIWVMPYFYFTHAKFFLDIKQEYYGVSTQEESDTTQYTVG